MDDRSPSSKVWKPCTGEVGGHLPFDEHDRFTGHPFWAGVPGYPDLRLFFVPAADGFPCLERYVRNVDTAYSVIDAAHIDTAALHFLDRTPGKETALIAARRDAAGRIRISAHGVDELPTEQQRRIRAGWRVAFGGLAKLRGRHPEDINAHVAELRANYLRLKPACTRAGHRMAFHPTHEECLKGSGVNIKASIARLRLMSLSWTKLRTQWNGEDGR